MELAVAVLGCPHEHGECQFGGELFILVATTTGMIRLPAQSIRCLGNSSMRDEQTIGGQPHPIDIEVRIEWSRRERNGCVLGRTVTKSHVFARFLVPRSATGLVWDQARDVRRE